MYDCKDIRMVYKYVINNFAVRDIALIEQTPCSELAATSDQAVKNDGRDPGIEAGRRYGAAYVSCAPRYKYLHLLIPFVPGRNPQLDPRIVEVLPPTER